MNNRFKEFKPKKLVFPEPMELVQVEDGRFIHQKQKYPFDGISAGSYSLDSQLKNGVELKPQGVRRLEKAFGSDIIRDSVSKSQADYNSAKANVSK